jgi:hypothetical protein
MTPTDYPAAIGAIMTGPGPVFCTLNVNPEIVNEAIGQWPNRQTKTRKQAVLDLRKKLGVTD